jgi:hypothetical protein
MINIVNIVGGLGNQMFGYAFFLAIKWKHPYALNLLNIEFTVNRHYGLELFKVFKISDNWRCFVSKCLDHQTVYKILSIDRVTQTDPLKYEPELTNCKRGNHFFNGYWQTEQYFKDIEQKVKDKFTFRESIISERNKQLSTKMLETESISVHIRRGDYLKEDGWNISEGSYYDNAISYINNNVNNPIFYFFSDDIEWCKAKFKGANYHFIDWNKGNDSWQDMYLMTKCKHNIIANSSFSWWGAWLNANENKLVLAPSVWLPGFNQTDAIPSFWIKIDY